jgi:hypothetical protein
VIITLFLGFLVIALASYVGLHDPDRRADFYTRDVTTQRDVFVPPTVWSEAAFPKVAVHFVITGWLWFLLALVVSPVAALVIVCLAQVVQEWGQGAFYLGTWRYDVLAGWLGALTAAGAHDWLPRLVR